MTNKTDSPKISSKDAVSGAVMDPTSPNDSKASTGEETEREVVQLSEPSDGNAPLVATEAELRAACRELAAGSGPFAVDAERASGYRYGQRNYLVQVRRDNVGTFLFDSHALPDLSALNEVMANEVWIFHAASQDLIPLREQKLFPNRIYDTEVGARILGQERVGLSAVTSELLGISLRKEHSSQDWSQRPIPESWLTYAALDVELLTELMEVQSAALAEAGKLDWAHQEFEHTRLAEPTAPRAEPWRRVSGLQQVKDRRKMAIVRELWTERDRVAQQRDCSPSRIMNDRAIVAAAQAMPKSVGALIALHEFGGTNVRRRSANWQRAIDTALSLPVEELPKLRGERTKAAPVPKVWADKNPLAAKWYDEAKKFVDQVSVEHHLPVENLLQPKVMRQLLWDASESIEPIDAAQYLSDHGARPWQVELTAPHLQTILRATN